ncbi:MAG TPA: hypothetical protein VFU27_10380 [Terriglobales bacterium]|nr:hypothetical protein [Terriglobales bacterium]
MPNFAQVLSQLRSERDRAQQEVDKLQDAIRVLEQLEGRGSRAGRGASGRGRFSAAARSRMAAAQRARWARVKRSANGAKPRIMSAAARRKIAAAQRARWARQKAAA